MLQYDVVVRLSGHNGLVRVVVALYVVHCAGAGYPAPALTAVVVFITSQGALVSGLGVWLLVRCRAVRVPPMII